MKKTLFLLLFAFQLSAGERASEFVWLVGLIGGLENTHAFSAPKELTKEAAAAVEENDIILLNPHHLPQFAKNMAPFIEHRYILVTQDQDIPVPWYFREDQIVMQLLEDERLIRWCAPHLISFTPNEKFVFLPVGIPYHLRLRRNYYGEPWQSVKDQEAYLVSLIENAAPTSERPPRIFADCNLNNSSKGNALLKDYLKEDRQMIYERLKNEPWIEFLSSWMKRSELWKKKSEHAFSISPPGRGMDCFRVWEDLALGCIVIVKSSPLDPLYEGLPVVIVSDWSDITQEKLCEWQEQYGDALINPNYREKLKTAYWEAKILGDL